MELFALADALEAEGRETFQAGFRRGLAEGLPGKERGDG